MVLLVALLRSAQSAPVTAGPAYYPHQCVAPRHTVYGPDLTRSFVDNPEPPPGAVESLMRCLFSRSSNWLASHVALDHLEITALPSARLPRIALPALLVHTGPPDTS